MPNPSPQQIAEFVWGRSARTLTSLGSVTVTTNNDKTNYTVTAGSYSIRASSTQRNASTGTGGGDETDWT